MGEYEGLHVLPSTRASSESNSTSQDPWSERTRILVNVVAPLILTLGIPGNLVTLCILQRLKVTTASFIFFKALAVVDLFNLLFNCVPDWLEQQFHVRPKHSNTFMCGLLRWFGYSYGLMASAMLVLVTVHRTLVVTSRDPARTIGKIKVARLTVAAVVAACFCYNLYIPFVSEVKDGRCVWTANFTQTGLKISGWINVLTFNSLPILVMMVSNYFLIRSMAQAAHAAPEAGGDPGEKKRLSSTTQTVVAVSLAFVVLTSPLTAVQIFTKTSPDLLGNSYITFLRVGALLLSSLNSAINFVLYVWTGVQFRILIFSLYYKNPQIGPTDCDVEFCDTTSTCTESMSF